MYIYRILENHGELSNVLDGNTLRDVVSIWYMKQYHTVKQTKTKNLRRKKIKYISCTFLDIFLLRNKTSDFVVIVDLYSVGGLTNSKIRNLQFYKIIMCTFNIK